MSQYGIADEARRFDHWGVGLRHTFPDEGSAEGTVVIALGDIVIAPYCRFVVDEIRIEIRPWQITKIDGGHRCDADARLARGRCYERIRSRSIRYLSPWMGLESLSSLGLDCDLQRHTRT
jgi:hypothetical protein